MMAGAKELLKRTSISFDELISCNFPPVRELVPGLIPCGEVLLVSAPKLGKSWMVLQLAFAAASGGSFMGLDPIPSRPVLYLAMEDGPRRISRRLRCMGVSKQCESVPLKFVFRFEVGEDAIKVVSNFFEEHQDEAPLVVLDTLGKVRSGMSSRGKESEYDRDYRIMSSFKEIVDRCDGGALLIVHHTRKDGYGDFLDSVSGTNGIAGAADTILKLSRKRGETDGLLEVTSRDASEGEYLVHFDKHTGIWACEGDSLFEASKAAIETGQNAGIGSLSQSILKCVSSQNGKCISPKEVAEQLGMGDNNTVSTYLRRLVEQGRINKDKRGQYYANTGVELTV